MNDARPVFIDLARLMSLNKALFDWFVDRLGLGVDASDRKQLLETSEELDADIIRVGPRLVLRTVDETIIWDSSTVQFVDPSLEEEFVRSLPKKNPLRMWSYRQADHEA